MGLPRAGPTLGAPWSRALALLLAGVPAWGCGPPEPPDAPVEEPAAPVQETRFEPPRPAPEPAAAPVATDLALSGSFAHEPHAGVRCATCHTGVQGHSLHAAVGCAECHPSPEGVEAVGTPSEEGCLTCHHLRQSARSCVDCHGDLPGRVFQVDQRLDLSVTIEPITRTLAFDHGWHRDRACATCHTPTPRAIVSIGCGDCHDAHHRAESDCAGCHEPSPLDHDETVHRGCTGTGCHGPVAAALPTSRSFCLTCHRDQVDHEPGGDCSTCHLFESSRTADSGTPRSPSLPMSGGPG
ncbi:MAG TPA: cytochrome c3 family protein [Longimicrobiales bacterium]|nr:cytochrome c3 family protein [Longimicrobiales bacterium]